MIIRELATSSPEAMGATLTVLARREDQIVVVSQRSMGSDDGQLGVDSLTAIATDPTVGMSTTAALNAAGTEIVDFGTSLVTVEGESGSVTPASGPTAR